jgi:hypothetical protein
MFGSFFDFVASFFGRFLSDNLLKFIAWKALLTTLLTVSLPVVVKNLLSSLFDTFSSLATSISSDGIDTALVSVTGLTGYFLDQFMVADCLSILLTAVIIRITLNFIPLVG